MKKRECAVVQDLLVLYEDNVLQEESMQMVEEHIRSCEECMRIYENAGKDLPISVEEPAPSEKEQEDAAAKAMKRLSRRITGRNMGILLSIIALIIIGICAVNELCNRFQDNYWGIAGMIYTIPEDEVEVTELYQLKNGDIYCTLKTEKQIGLWQASDWILPEGKRTETTDDAAQMVSFRQRTPWELDTPGYNQVTIVFAVTRQGTLAESGKEITQRCSEISYYGRTIEDKQIIWRRGQKVKEAPEEIERKVIEEAIRRGQARRAMQECENMGWDIDEIISEVYREDNDISQIYDGAYNEEEVIFSNDYNMLEIVEW